MTIRTAKIEDAKEIARIHVDTWRDAYTGIVPDSYLCSLSKKKRQKQWEEILSTSDASTIVVLNNGGHIAGWSAFGQSRDEDGEGKGELYAIYLDSAYWGKGFGREMIVESVECLGKSGFDEVTLWVLEENMRTRRFYEKGGFAPDGARKPISFNGFELIELRYVRIL